MSDQLLSIGLGGLSKAHDWASSFDAAVKIVRWGESWGDRVTEAMRDEAPYREGDGEGGDGGEHLRDSIAFAGARPVGAGAQMSWTSDVDWAEYVVDGTEAHEIHAVVAKALRWLNYGHAPGALVFAKSVMHPGTAPNPFPLRAIEKLAPAMVESLAVLFADEEE